MGLGSEKSRRFSHIGSLFNTSTPSMYTGVSWALMKTAGCKCITISGTPSFSRIRRAPKTVPAARITVGSPGRISDFSLS